MTATLSTACRLSHPAHLPRQVNCNIVDKEAEAWAEVLSTSTTITSLNLESNSIATTGIEALAAAIAKNGKVGSQRLPAAARRHNPR